MGIHQTIEKLREKPQHVRERILLGFMAVIIPIIFTIWIATFSFHSNFTGNFSFLKNMFGNLSTSFHQTMNAPNPFTKKNTPAVSNTPAPTAPVVPKQ